MPRVKLNLEQAMAVESSAFLSPAQATLFRSGTMREANLGQDRPDISETVKCLSRHMSAPREGHVIQFKRLARYLRGKPRCVLEYPIQASGDVGLNCHVDSDWAGDPITRRSTSGAILRRGVHLIRHSSTLQTLLSLSSAEAEYLLQAFRIL